MSKDLILIQNPLFNPSMTGKLLLPKLLACNKITSKYGLVLSESEALELVETRGQALSGLGRVEFTVGVLDKLIVEFCDSPYISQHNYVETINELVEIFYYFKNETLDEIDDDDLISYLKQSFDNSCNGSLELLKGRDLEKLAHKVRFSEEEEEPFDEWNAYQEEFDE